MAGAGAKLFTSGSVLTADQVNTYLMDQTIMKFASTSARDASFGGAGEPSLSEGMFAYTTDTNTLWLYTGATDGWVNVLGSDIGQQALSNRNVIINGAMQIAQRGTSTASLGTVSGYFTADRWNFAIAQALTTGRFTQSVENDAPTGSGFRKSLKMLVTTASTLAAGDRVLMQQNFEGQNLQQFLKGTASAKQFSVSFWVKSNLTGTYIAELADVDNTRAVSASYTISASGTWEKKTITFPADTTGVLDNDENLSFRLNMMLASGTNFTSGTLQTTWGSITSANRDVGQVNLLATLNNYWQITGVQLEAGAVATPFEFEDYGVTLAKCQRYLPAITTTAASEIATGMCISTTQPFCFFPFQVMPRVSPTGITATAGNFVARTSNGATTASFSAIAFNNASASGCMLLGTTSGLTAGDATTLILNGTLLFTGCEL